MEQSTVRAPARALLMTIALYGMTIVGLPVGSAAGAEACGSDLASPRDEAAYSADAFATQWNVQPEQAIDIEVGAYEYNDPQGVTAPDAPQIIDQRLLDANFDNVSPSDGGSWTIGS